MAGSCMTDTETYSDASPRRRRGEIVYVFVKFSSNSQSSDGFVWFFMSIGIEHNLYKGLEIDL